MSLRLSRQSVQPETQVSPPRWCHLESFVRKPIKIGFSIWRDGHPPYGHPPAPLGTLDRSDGTAGCWNRGAADRRADARSRNADMSTSALRCCSALGEPSGRQPITPCQQTSSEIALSARAFSGTYKPADSYPKRIVFGHSKRYYCGGE